MYFFVFWLDGRNGLSSRIYLILSKQNREFPLKLSKNATHFVGDTVVKSLIKLNFRLDAIALRVCVNLLFCSVNDFCQRNIVKFEWNIVLNLIERKRKRETKPMRVSPVFGGQFCMRKTLRS